MVRGFFGGRPRAQTATDVISKPTLTYTDAVPRNDLQTLGQISASMSPSDRGGAVSRAESEWLEASEKGSQDQGWQGTTPPFDFQMTDPPEGSLFANPHVDAVVDENMIGIALGSPGILSSHVPMAEKPNVGSAPTPDSGGDTTRAPLRRKSSKWKKIGGLFKAKARMSPASNPPFYQVQVNGQPLQNSPPELNFQSQYVLLAEGGTSKKGHRKLEKHREMQPYREIESHLHYQQEIGEKREAWPRSRSRAEHMSDFPLTGPEPLLHIDIPDVQMERYSVMFGNLLGKEQPSRLLARRSRTLDSLNLRVPGEDPYLKSQQSHRPQRRATSPTPAKSPAFTLFPATPSSKQSKVLGSDSLPRGPSPLARVQTVPVEPGPEKLSSTEKENPYLMIHTPLATSTTSQSEWESEASFVSPISVDPSSSDDAAVLLKKMPTKSYVDIKEEPSWEMITNMTESPNQQQQVSPEMTSRITMEPTPPATPPKDLSTSPFGIAPFNPSRSKLERVTSPREIDTADSRRKTTSDPRSEREAKSNVNGTSETPKIEVSITRTVSVSRGKIQTLVPVGSSSDRLNPAERLVDKQPQVPQLVDIRKGHRHEKSQIVLIETA